MPKTVWTQRLQRWGKPRWTTKMSSPKPSSRRAGPDISILKFWRGPRGSQGRAHFTLLQHRIAAKNCHLSLSGRLGATRLPRMNSERSKEAARAPTSVLQSGSRSRHRAAVGLESGARDHLGTASAFKMPTRPAAELPKHAKAWPKRASQ